MTTTLEVAYIGTSENIEAEYGAQCDAPFCIALFYDGEPVSVEGFATKDGMIRAAKAEYDCAHEYML